MQDVGVTHVALAVSDLAASVAFYARYASMQVVHERHDASTGAGVAWLSDLTRPFVVVLIEVGEVTHPLGGPNHIGVAVATRTEVDRLAALAIAEDCLVSGPDDAGYPVGYWAILRDPDGHHVELAHGQEVGLAVDRAVRPAQ